MSTSIVKPNQRKKKVALNVKQKITEMKNLEGYYKTLDIHRIRQAMQLKELLRGFKNT